MKNRQRALRAAARGMGLVLTAAALTGCGTTRRGSMTTGPAGGGSDAGKAEGLVSALNARVETRGGNEDGAALAGILRPAIEGQLLSRGFAMDAGQADVRIDLAVEAAPFDQEGNYYVFDSEVEAVVALPDRDERLGGQRFDYRGPRTLDRAPALRATADGLTPLVTAWVDRMAGRASQMVGAVRIAVDLPWRSRNEMPQYADLFVREVGAVSGVIDVALVDQSRDDRRQVFRVVYRKSAFPAGILNRLALIEELNLAIED
jgi:hypothetical protein